MGRPSRLWETRVADICSSTAGWILPDAAAFNSSRPPVGKWALSHWTAARGTRRSILRKDCFSAPILWAPAPHPCAGGRQATKRELLQQRGFFRVTSGGPTILSLPRHTA